MSNIELGVIDAVQSKLPDVRTAVFAHGPTDGIQDPAAVLTNSDLLLKTLKSFFSNGNSARYLPASIKAQIASVLTEISNLAAAIPSGADDPSQGPPPSIPTLLQSLDTLYAICLQYGLITFGFDSKLAQQQLELFRASVAEAEAAKDAAIAAIKSSESAATEGRSRFEQSIEHAIEEARARTADVLSHLEQANAAAQAASTQVATIDELSKKASEVLQKSSTLLAAIDEQRANTASTINATLASVQAAEKQTTDATANAKAQAAEAATARASAASQLESIRQFSTDIENYKNEMSSVKSLADAKFGELSRLTDESVKAYRAETDAIVAENNALNEQIKDHLEKAVGVSLFRAFGQRQESLLRTSRVWASITFSAILLAIAAAMVVAYSLESGKGYGPMIFARLLIGIPLAFLVGFAARQYSRERRAEEEYAFKSLISVSLEPYRNLIEKMNSGSPEDKEFLKDLIRNIFDNPAKRLYPSLSPDGETSTTDATPLRTSRSPSTPPPASSSTPVPPTA